MTNLEKTSKKEFKHYNGTPVPDGFVLVPYKIDKVFLKNHTDTIKENLQTIKKCGQIFKIAYVAIPKEQEQDYMKIYNKDINDLLEPYRPGRCILGYKKGEPLICRKKCSECTEKDKYERFKNPILSALSYESYIEETGCEISDYRHQAPDSSFAYECMLKELLSYLDKINPRYSKILLLKHQGSTVDEIKDHLGLGKTQTYKHIENLRKFVDDFFQYNS